MTHARLSAKPPRTFGREGIECADFYRIVLRSNARSVPNRKPYTVMREQGVSLVVHGVPVSPVVEVPHRWGQEQPGSEQRATPPRMQRSRGRARRAGSASSSSAARRGSPSTSARSTRHRGVSHSRGGKVCSKWFDDERAPSTAMRCGQRGCARKSNARPC